ncbi:MAG: DUF3324 domain-containing protein [Streptococcaceae bacterium]|nr:DUF3324 domain-containing protein [Streptococcaceae bacterium]
MKKLLTLLFLLANFIAIKTTADEVVFSVAPVLDANQTLAEQTISAKYQPQEKLSFDLKNHSDAPISIDIKNNIISGVSFLQAPSAISIPAGESQNVTIPFKPEAFKQESNAENINTLVFSAQDNSYTYQVNASPTTPPDTEKISIEKTEAVSVNQKHYIRVVLKNNSNAWINNITVLSHLLNQSSQDSETHHINRIAPKCKAEFLLSGPPKFKVGFYLMTTSINTVNQTWQLKSNLTLSKIQVTRLNGKGYTLVLGKNTLLLYPLLCLFILLVVTSIIQIRLIYKDNHI